MRILIYSMNFWPEQTGIGKYSGEMAFFLATLGHDVRVICSAPWYPEWKIPDSYSGSRYHSEVSCGVEILRCPSWVPACPSALKRILCLASFAVSSSVAAIRSIFWKPEIVFSVEPPLFCLPSALLLARFSGARSWLHIQDFEVDAALQLGFLKGGRGGGILRFGERFLMRRFDRCSTISEKMLELLRQRSGQPEKCILFRNWVDLTAVFPKDGESTFRAELKLESWQRVALYSGNMGEKQGLELLIDSARLLESRKELVFVLCGAGAAAERVRAMGNGLTNIRWLPVQPVERLNDLLNLADVHLLPQRGDAADLVMPSKLTGMLASGRPVVATAAHGTQIQKVVERCGLVVAPGDVASFSDAIIKLVHDFRLSQEYGLSGRRIAESEFGTEAVLKGFEQDLASCISGSDQVTAGLGSGP